MTERKIVLTPELETFVEERLANGPYKCASEIIGDALRLLIEREELRRIRLEKLKAEVAKGIASADRGELTPLNMEEIKAEARSRFDEKHKPVCAQ